MGIRGKASTSRIGVLSAVVKGTCRESVLLDVSEIKGIQRRWQR